MTPEDLLIGGIVLLAALTQGVIGFGFGLVAMSVLPRLLPLPSAVAFVAVYGVVVSALGFWRYRRGLRVREVVPMVLAAALALPLGVYGLSRLDPDLCTRVLGVVISLYALWSLLDRGEAVRPSLPIRRIWAWPAGFSAGLLGGAFATGGPPVIAYATARRWSPAAFKGTLQCFFMCSTLMHLGLLAGHGILGPDTLARNLIYAPLIPVGAWVGAHYGDRLHPVLFRRIVLTALLLLGLSYLLLGS